MATIVGHVLGGSLLNFGTVVVFFVTLYVSYWYVAKRRLGNLPPGPPALPIIGSLPWLAGPDIREVLHRMSSQYGKIFTIYLGGRRTVILSDHEVIKDAFVKHSNSFIDRPQDLFYFKDVAECRGLVATNGRVWREQRALLHHVFREFGVGSSKLEDKILEESRPMIDALCAGDGPVDPHDVLQMAMANIAGNIAFGLRHDYDDPRFLKFMDGMNTTFKLCGGAGALTVFPFLKHLPGDLFGFHRMIKAVDLTKVQHREDFEMHKETHQPGVARCLIDIYLDQIEKTKDDPGSTYTEEELLRLVGDLFGAGTETTSTTLTWAIVYMLRYPEVYARVLNEVDDVIGNSRWPSLKDKLHMPYTEACLLEILRMGDIVPLGVPRETTHTFTFHGFDIPVGTTVMPCFYSIHRDPDIFPNPYKFDPERFLDNTGRVCGHENIIPFSIGKRNCVGEAFARMEIFLMFTSMIQQLKFELPEGKPVPEETGIVSITHAAEPFELFITRR